MFRFIRSLSRIRLIRFFPVDKSKYLIVCTTEQYIEKLNDVFEPTKLIKLTNNPLKSDIVK